MERKEVYKAFDTEREYQEKETSNPNRPDMIEEFNMGTAMQALNVMLGVAGNIWYTESPENNYEGTMNMLRKIGGVCTQMGEKYGMPERK